MIRYVLGTPFLSLTDCRILVNDMGLPLVHVSDAHPGGAKLLKPEANCAFTPDYVAFADGLEVFHAYSDRLASSRNSFVVFVHDAVSMLQDFAVPLHIRPDMTRADLLTIMSNGDVNFNGLTRAHDSYAAALLPMSTESFVQKLYPAFYRITDKATRVQTQQEVYAYLYGLTKRPPVTGVQIIDNTVRGAHGVAIRSASIVYRASGLQAAMAAFPTVDDHTLNYVKAQATKTTPKRKTR